MWCLGILLYELLHGYPPYTVRSINDMKYKIYHQKYDIDKSIPKDCVDLIQVLL